MAALSPAQKDIPVADRWREDPFGRACQCARPPAIRPARWPRILARSGGHLRLAIPG